MTELRADDLRFTFSEAAEFLNQVMGLDLSAENIAALETRTEGWIAGLQLAALSIQGRADTASFIQAFTGSHRFVLDYLLEEVLHQQPQSVQSFLLQTSILDRLCGPLCEAVCSATKELPPWPLTDMGFSSCLSPNTTDSPPGEGGFPEKAEGWVKSIQTTTGVVTHPHPSQEGSSRLRRVKTHTCQPPGRGRGGLFHA